MKNTHFIFFSRLYENLPDVRQKLVEKQRQETYAANREKAQEFQKVCVCGYKIIQFLAYLRDMIYNL